MKRLRSEGWRLELIYLELQNVEMARSRVAERVLHGGHDIPPTDTERHFFRSLKNFLGEFAILADRAVCYLNAGRTPVTVFTQHGTWREVAEPEILQLLEKATDDGCT